MRSAVLRASRLLGLLTLLAPIGADAGPASIPVNDRFDVLHLDRRRPDLRRAYAQAGRLMKGWTIDLAGTGVDGFDLLELATATPADEPFERALREGIGRPVDAWDFLLLLDDLLAAGRRGLWGRRVYVLPGRARAIGALIHPDDVFRADRPRRYPYRYRELHIDRPRRRPQMSPAEDGDPLGPHWVFRYKNPLGREAKLRALAELNPSGTFADRVASLINQLEDQGADVGLFTTVRNRRRGYLMWGAFRLSRRKTRRQVLRTVVDLERLNQEWNLEVPIRWTRPGGWRATVEAARLMADAYDVVYASRRGARQSNHYDGLAVDMTAVGLPRRLTLTAPDGRQQTFDLSDPAQTRDLNLTPELIDWVEEHFQMEKLEADYPHWNDAAPPDPARRAMAAAAAAGPPPLVAPASTAPAQAGEPAARRDWLALLLGHAPVAIGGLGLAGLLLIAFGLRRRPDA